MGISSVVPSLLAAVVPPLRLPAGIPAKQDFGHVARLEALVADVGAMQLPPEAHLRALIDRYAAGERMYRRGITKAGAPLEYPETGVYHPATQQRISESLRLLPASKAREGTVGLILLRSYLLGRDCAHYDGAIAAFEAAGCEPFRYTMKDGREMTMGYWTAPEEALDSPEAMRPWARRAMEAALVAANAKPAAKPAVKKRKS